VLGERVVTVDKWAGAISVDRLEVYRAGDGFRWRHIAPNGEIVADSGEAYTRMHDAFRGAQTHKDTIGTAVVVYDDGETVEGHRLEEIT
jgi:uncharacterized protein YegP (UPF0339 family)